MKLDRTALTTIIIILIIIAGAAYYVWFSGAAEDRQMAALPTDNFNKAAQSINLTNLDDNPVELKDFRGKVLVANSWASWCPFCATELKDFESLASEYKDRGVVVLAINRAESKPQIQAYLNTLSNLDNLVILQDKEDSYYKFIGGFSMPETIFYDTKGNVVFHKRGFMKLEEMRSNIESTLNVGQE